MKTFSYIILSAMVAIAITTILLLIGGTAVLVYETFGLKGYLIGTSILAAISAFLGVKFAQYAARRSNDTER